MNIWHEKFYSSVFWWGCSELMSNCCHHIPIHIFTCMPGKCWCGFYPKLQTFESPLRLVEQVSHEFRTFQKIYVFSPKTWTTNRVNNWRCISYVIKIEMNWLRWHLKIGWFCPNKILRPWMIFIAASKWLNRHWSIRISKEP